MVHPLNHTNRLVMMLFHQLAASYDIYATRQVVSVGTNPEAAQGIYALGRCRGDDWCGNGCHFEQMLQYGFVRRDGEVGHKLPAGASVGLCPDAQRRV